MNITGTGIAVALAIVIAFGLLVFGPGMFRPEALTENQFAPIDMSTQEQVAALSGTPLPEALPTELTITDDVPGEGAEAAPGDTVSVRYLGRLPDGTVFDATANRNNEPITFTLGAGQVISGWDKGIAGMKEGGTRRLIIPPAEGYGDRANGPIPANSTLIFDVELVRVVR